MDGASVGDDADGDDELGPVPCPVCGCEPGERAEFEHGDGPWFMCIPCGCDCHDDADAGCWGWWW